MFTSFYYISEKVRESWKKLEKVGESWRTLGKAQVRKCCALPVGMEVGLRSTMDNMDDHPSSIIGLEGLWMVIHGSSRGPWMVIWTL